MGLDNTIDRTDVQCSKVLGPNLASIHYFLIYLTDDVLKSELTVLYTVMELNPPPKKKPSG